MGWSIQTCTLLLLLLGIISPVHSADDCVQVPISSSEGKLNLTYTSDKPKATCYQFEISGVNKSIYFMIDPDLSTDNVSSVSIYNVNSTGALTTVSDHTFTTPTSDPYVAVGFGRTAAASDTKEVMRVVVNLTNALKENGSLVIGAFDSDKCELTYPTLPSVISNPDYEIGGDTSVTFTCVLKASVSSAPTTVSSAVFTQFMFTSPSYLQVNSSMSGKYDGTDLPSDTIITDEIVLEMKINSKNGDTFSMSTTSSTKDCTRYVPVNSTGISITSPGYPTEQYSNNLYCKIILVSQDDKLLKLELTDIELALDGDKVEVIDGAASRSVDTRMIAYLSAMDDYKHKDAAMVSSGSLVMIRFITDELGTAKGFSFTASQIEEGGRFYAPSDVVFAPGSSTDSPVELVMQADKDTKVEFIPTGRNMPANATFKCYDGDSSNGPLVASYSSDFLMFPAYSTNHKMLCVADGFKDNTSFNASVQSVANSLTKFSYSGSDSLFVTLPVGEAGESKYQYNWIVQPDASQTQAIQLVISKVKFPSTDAEISIRVQTMRNNTVFYPINASTPLPFRISVDSADGLRLSVDVVPADVASDLSAISEGAQPTTLSLSAEYTLAVSRVEVNESTGTLMSPFYPKGVPQDTDLTWSFDVSPKKSLLLSFSTPFELPASSFIKVAEDNNGTVYSSVIGPSSAAPSDLVINNTKGNESLTVIVQLRTGTQGVESGVQVAYTFLDSGYSASLDKAAVHVSTPSNQNSSYVATWVLSVNKTNSKELLQRVTGNVSFELSNSTTLELRDGANSFSPLLPIPKGKSKTYSFTTSSNKLFVSYKFVEGDNSSASPLTLSASLNVCKSSFQCEIDSNLTVCFSSLWRCDGIYHCRDGKDEQNCGPKPATTTTTPKPSEKGTKGWVVAVSLLGGVALGAILTIIILTVIRKRAGNYSRLTELMTPVPT